MLRQQSPALHVRPVSEDPTRMTSKQGASNFSTKMGNDQIIHFLSCLWLYLLSWSIELRPAPLYQWLDLGLGDGMAAPLFQPGRLDIQHNLPYSSPSESKAFRGGWSPARFINTLTMIAFLTGSTSGAYEIHHFRGVVCASSHRPWCAHQSSTWRFLFLFLHFCLFCAVSSVIRHIVLQRAVYKLYVTMSTCYLFGFPFGRRNQ